MAFGVRAIPLSILRQSSVDRGVVGSQAGFSSLGSSGHTVRVESVFVAGKFGLRWSRRGALWTEELCTKKYMKHMDTQEAKGRTGARGQRPGPKVQTESVGQHGEGGVACVE